MLAAWRLRGLEMSQNSMRLPWPREEVDSRLRHIMFTILKNAWETAEEYGHPRQSCRRRQHCRICESG